MKSSFIKGLLAILTLTILSCKENEKNVVPENLNTTRLEVKEGRLNFNKLEDFNNEISNLSRSSRSRDYSSIIKERVGKNAQFSTLRKSPQELSYLRTSETEIDTLIQDDLFASFLNDQREISVDNIIYKITPEGTYACTSDKYQRLLEILSNNPKHGDSDKEDDEAGDSKTIEDGIFFYDSFSSIGKSKIVEFEAAESLLEQETPSNNARVSYNYLPTSVYNSFPSHAFGRKTVIGQWLESVLGNREKVYININDNERLKLSFYDNNYLIFKSIGIKVEAQHKTWIGWNGTLNVHELRLGWDAINFDTNLPGAPTTGLKKVDFSNLNLGALGISVAAFNLVDGESTDPLAEAIQKAIKGIVDESLSITVSKLYTLIKQNLGNQNAWEQQYTAAFRVIFPNKVSTLLGRYEEIENNASQISRTFDWSTPILGFSTTGGAMQPIYKTGTTYDIKEGSVYACATHNGKTVGIRIIKD